MDTENRICSSLPFHDLNYRDLQKLAKSLGLPANLKKNQLCVLIELAKLGKRDSVEQMIEEYRQHRNKLKNELLINGNSNTCDGKRKRRRKHMNKEDFYDEALTVLEDSIFNVQENNFERNYSRFGNVQDEHLTLVPQDKRQLSSLTRQHFCNTLGGVAHSITSPPFLSLPPPPPNTPFIPNTPENTLASVQHSQTENQVVDHSQNIVHDQNIIFQHSGANSYNYDSVRASYNTVGFDLNHSYPHFGNSSFTYQKEIQKNKLTSSCQFMRATMRNDLQSQYELQYYEKNLLSLKKMIGSTENQVSVSDVFTQNLAPFNSSVGISGQYDNMNNGVSRQISFDKQNKIMKTHHSVMSSSTSQTIASENIRRNSYPSNESHSVYNNNGIGILNFPVGSSSGENLQDSNNQTEMSFPDSGHSTQIFNSLLLQDRPSSQQQSNYYAGNCASSSVSNDNHNNVCNGIANSTFSDSFLSESPSNNGSNNDSSQLPVLSSLPLNDPQKDVEAVNKDVQSRDSENESSINIIKSITESIKQVETLNVSNSFFVTCRYEMNGCTQVICKLEDLIQHEQNCVFQPTPCPLRSDVNSQCYWKSNLNSLHNHITEAHATEIISRCSERFLLPLSKMRNFTQIHFLQSVKNHIFITTIERVDLQVYVIMQYLKQSAKDNIVSTGLLKVTSKNCAQFTWDGEINPYYGSKTMNLRSKGKSLVFDFDSSQDILFMLEVDIMVKEETPDSKVNNKNHGQQFILI